MEDGLRFLVISLILSVGLSALAAPAPSEKNPLPTIRQLKLQTYLDGVTPDQILEKIDSAGKNAPDIFVIFKKLENGGRALLLQAFDLNRDGNIDLVKHFINGKMVRTEMDLDYDSRVDVVSEYNAKTSELVRKTQTDGTTNIWKFYLRNELRKKELDRNQDGKADMWVYYRNGKVLRTEIDQKFDGKAIRVEGALNQKRSS